MVCPHAGYEFSALIAAIGYKQLAGRDFSTVILLGPSHYAAFEGAFVSTGRRLPDAAGDGPRVAEGGGTGQDRAASRQPAVRGRAPDVVAQSPRSRRRRAKTRRKRGNIRLEVQLPFLQRTLHDFSIVPVIFGDVDPAKWPTG